MLALEGIRVLDLSERLAGPGTTMYLADQGAEVIKVEKLDGGDAGRTQNPEPFYQGNPPGFILLNRNKKSITVDTRKPEGLQVIQKLAARSDVLVQNFRPGVAERLGVGYEQLSKINPRLIYASVSAYGLKGPYADKGGYDRILQGLAGLMGRRLEDGTPVTTGVYASDGATPMIMAFGIMVALWAREKTGRGQRVDGSLLHTWLALQTGNMARAKQGPPSEERNESVRTPGVFRCGDGVHINIAPNNRKQLASLACLMGLDDPMKDPAYKQPAGYSRTRKQVFAIAEKRLQEGSAEEWLVRIQKADVPSGPILTKEEVFSEPQILENEMLTMLQHPVIGPVMVTNTPVLLSDTPGGVRTPAPLLGEHTDAVLGEIGYSSEQIANLRVMEVI